MDFSKVTKIVIPEGEVSSISIGSTVVWSAVEDVEIADDWDTIIANIENGTYRSKYKIGNYKPLDLGDEGIINMQIVAFDTDILAKGDTKAPITWISKDALAKKYRMNPQSVDNGGTFIRTEGTNTWVNQNQIINNTKCASDWIITANAAGTLTITSTADCEPGNYDYLTVSVDDTIIVDKLCGANASNVWSMECTEGQIINVSAYYIKDNYTYENSDTATITFDATMDITIAATEEKPLELTLGENSAGGWEYSELRNKLQNDIMPLIPENVRAAIKEVQKSQKSYSIYGENTLETSTETVWIPSAREILGEIGAEPSGTIYATSSLPNYTWLRSVYSKMDGSNCYFYMKKNETSSASTVETVRNICIGFCVG